MFVAFSNPPRRSTKGVLPEPPTERFPTLITGLVRRRVFNTFLSYREFRTVTPVPNSAENRFKRSLRCFALPINFATPAACDLWPPFASAPFRRLWRRALFAPVRSLFRKGASAAEEILPARPRGRRRGS